MWVGHEKLKSPLRPGPDTELERACSPSCKTTEVCFCPRMHTPRVNARREPVLKKKGLVGGFLKKNRRTKELNINYQGRLKPRNDTNCVIPVVTGALSLAPADKNVL